MSAFSWMTAARNVSIITPLLTVDIPPGFQIQPIGPQLIIELLNNLPGQYSARIFYDPDTRTDLHHTATIEAPKLFGNLLRQVPNSRKIERLYRTPSPGHSLRSVAGPDHANKQKQRVQ
jgi:hypothetical protein